MGQLPFIDWLLWRIKWASIVLVCLSPDPLQPCKQCFKASVHSCILLVCFDYQANALVKHSQRWFLIQGFSSFHEAIFSIRPVSWMGWLYWLPSDWVFTLSQPSLLCFVIYFLFFIFFSPCTAVFKQANKQFPKALKDASDTRCSVMIRALRSVTSHKLWQSRNQLPGCLENSFLPGLLHSLAEFAV